jgi:hypothetical protein
MKVHEKTISVLRARPGDWFAYRNEAMDSADGGNFIYLKCGPGCTFEEPPTTGPDGPWGAGWKYVLYGQVDLDTGLVVKHGHGVEVMEPIKGIIGEPIKVG